MRRVFLSYASKNLDEVLLFDCQLRRHGVPLWRDRVDLAKGAPTEEEVRRAGDEALGFTFYLTHDAVESEWVRVKELGSALKNAQLDSSFGIVPVFRHHKDEVAERILKLAKDGEPQYDLRKSNGYIIRATDGLDLEPELATAAASVLHSTLRTLKKHAPSGSRLRLAAITRHTKPWTACPTDLAVDWSHLYPPTSKMLPNNGIGSTQLLAALSRLGAAIDHEWKDKRVQIVPHCHPSMALAMGFLFRRGSGFDLEVLDHATGAAVLGPPRPNAPEPGLWTESFSEPYPASRDIALAIGVSRDIAPDVRRVLTARGINVGAIVALTPLGGPSNAAIPMNDPGLQHRLAVAAVQRTVGLQARRGVGAIHLFIAIPGTLAVLLGQQLTNVGAVQVYDFDNESKQYAPVFELCHM